MKLEIKKYMISWNWNYAVILILLFPIVGFSQVEDLKTDEEVMVIAPFNPSIRKAKKMNFAPKADSNQTHKIAIDYLTKPKLFATNFSLQKLKAAKFVDRKSPKYAQNFVKAGFGLYTTPYVELFVNNKMSNRSQVGVYVRHLSTSGEINDVAYAGNSLSSAKVWTKHIRRKQTTTLSVDYMRNQIHDYGFKVDDFPLELANTNNNFKEDIKQVFSHARFNLNMEGNFDKKQRDWGIDMSYTYFWDIYNTQEHLIDLNAHYDYAVDWVDTKDQYIGLALGTQTYQTIQNFSGFVASVDSTSGYFHGVYDLNPYYHLGFESLSLDIGAKLSMGLDSNARVTVAPMVNLSVGLLGDQLKVYATVDGGFYNQSIAALSGQNHFISPLIPLKYTENKYRIQAGLKGHYSSYLDYHAYVETASFKDMPMFVTDTLSKFNNTFTTIYDGGQKLGAGLEVLFKTERWNVKVRGQYQSYTMDTTTRAWHKPELSYDLGVSYYVLENLKVTGLLIGQSKMYNLYEGEKPVEPWMDFSLMADYYLSKNLGFFLNVNNIFSNEYEVWYGYPVQSIGVMGGVHFAF